MRYRTIFVSRDHRYALERDVQTAKPVFSIPVSNRMMDYEEWYAISEEEFERFLVDREAAKAFATQCGRREQDDRLDLEARPDRGVY